MPLSSKGAIAIGAGLALGAGAGVGIGLYLKSKQTTSPPPPGGSGSGPSGGSSPPPTGCTSDSQCGSCQRCIGGSCGTPGLPYSLNIVQNNGGSQDEGVASAGVPFTNIAACVWSSLSFTPYGQNTYSVQGRLVDSSGGPVPCVQLDAQFEGGELVVLSVSPTDSNGNFTLTYQLNGPFQGNSGCPGPGATNTTTAVDALDFYLGNVLIGSTVCTVIVYITGV